MAYKGKERSRILKQAEGRAKSMEIIDTAQGKVINYGSEEKPLTSATMRVQIKNCDDKLEEYNDTLKTADSMASQLKAEEDILATMYAATVLDSAPGKFGDDAVEIEQLGGTRSSQRKRPVRKPKAQQ